MHAYGDAAMMRPPIAIGFDFDHTLGVDNGLERKAMYAYAEELGRPLDPHDADWRARIDDLLATFRAGDISMDEMIARFAAALDVAGARADRWREICYGLVDPLVRAIDGAPELLAALRERGVPAAVLTNGWTPLQQKKIARAFGAETAARLPVIVSDAIGAVKPAPAAFDALAAALGAPREQLWYVGDNALGDVGGALAAGLRAVWFNWENQSYPQDLPPPTLTVASLRELEAWVENTIAP
jgi:FMN phosphatase YigB (HAD superfamily)